jgi:hypothetical protein
MNYELYYYIVKVCFFDKIMTQKIREYPFNPRHPHSYLQH